jgi:hypothetical protein
VGCGNDLLDVFFSQVQPTLLAKLCLWSDLITALGADVRHLGVDNDIPDVCLGQVLPALITELRSWNDLRSALRAEVY